MRRELKIPDRDPDFTMNYGSLQKWKMWWKEKIFVYVNGINEETSCTNVHRLVRKRGKSYYIEERFSRREVELCDRFQDAYKRWREDQIVERILLG